MELVYLLLPLPFRLKAEVLHPQTVYIWDKVCSFTSGNFEVFRKEASLETRAGKAISS